MIGRIGGGGKLNSTPVETLTIALFIAIPILVFVSSSSFVAVFIYYGLLISAFIIGDIVYKRMLGVKYYEFTSHVKDMENKNFKIKYWYNNHYDFNNLYFTKVNVYPDECQLTYKEIYSDGKMGGFETVIRISKKNFQSIDIGIKDTTIKFNDNFNKLVLLKIDQFK